MFEQQGGNAESTAQPVASDTPQDSPASDLGRVQLAQAAGAPIGQVEELLGSVTITRTDGSSVTAAPGTPVFLDDVVTTGAGSSVEIQFIDGTRFSLGQDGQMTLDTLVFDPNGSSNELDLSVAQGAFTFVTGAIAGAPGEGMEVRVPVGTIGIRGTAVGGGPDTTTADTTDYTIVLLPEPDGVGRIVLTDLFGRSVILDNALEAMDISSAGLAPGEPIQLTREQVIALLGLAVENIEDILEEIQNFQPEESPEDDVNPEAGPQQEGQLLDTTPNTGGIYVLAGRPLTLGEITSLFTIGDEQGLNGQLGGFTPRGSLGDEGDEGGFGGTPIGSDGPDDDIDTVIDDDDDGEEPPEFLTLTGDDGDNVLDASGFAGPTNIVGNGGQDTLIGSSFGDILNGGGGNDTLAPGAGNDTVDGGAGVDTIDYSGVTTAVTVNLEAGTATGGAAVGTDTLNNVENVTGGAGNDSITGDDGDNVLDGGEGNDTLTGLGGDDTIIGGGGSDIAVFTGDMEDYTIEGAEGGGFFITDNRDGPENDGTDFVAGDVEVIRFDDGDVVLTPNAVNDVDTVSADDQIEREATNGSAIRTTVDVSAGAVLTLRYNFLDSEPDTDEGTFKDFAVIVIGDQVFKLADVDQSELPISGGQVQFDEQTGYWTFSFTFTEAGEYTLGLAVMNEDDTLFDAGLLVDSISISGGSFSEGFEDGINDDVWDTIGDVSTAGAFGGISPDQGEQQAVLLSRGAQAADIEELLGLDPGELSGVISLPSISGNVLDNDGIGNADIAVASVAYDGDPADVQDVNGSVSGNIVTFTAADGSWELRFDLATGTYVFTVLGPLDYEGADSLSFDFRYSIDGLVGSDSAVLTIVVEDGLPSQGDNQPPASLVDIDGDANTITVDADNGAAVQITAQASDPDAGDTLTYSLTDDAGGLFEVDQETGVVTLVEGGTLNDFVGEELTITVRATDEAGEFTEEDFTIAVTSDNQDPVAVDDSDDEFVTDNTTNFTVHADELLANDSDPDDDGLFISNVSGAVGGSVSIGVENIITFTPEDGYTGQASFQYTVSDGEGGEDTATVTLMVTAPDNLPPAELLDDNDAGNTISRNNANGTIVGITALASDPNGDAVTYSLVDSAGGIFAIDENTGVVTLANRDALQQIESSVLNITIVATDALGAQSASETFAIAITDGATSGDDILVGTPDSDTIMGLAGNDTIDGLESGDLLHGGEGNDTIFGGQAADTIRGGDGDDVLYGGEGSDVLWGGPGDDQIDGGTEDDAVDYSVSPDGVVVNLAGLEASDGHGATDTLTSIEHVLGSEFADTITGTDSYNFLSGNAGDDTLNGAGGDDILNGGDDSDTLNGGDGVDSLSGDAGDDELNGEGGTDYLYGGAGIDTMNGGGDADTLFGTLGEDTFNGGGGDDILTFDTLDPLGGTVDGGDGNDTLIFQVAGQTVDLSVFSVVGVETINITGFGGANNTLALSASDVLNVSSNEADMLRVQGNAGDELFFHDAENWTVQTVNTGNQSFNVFTNGQASVWADSAIEHNVISPDA
jgi:Ca2+-binding RTX toxin-like protein